MSARLAVLLAAFVLALPSRARADGKVFSQVTAVKTTTPDQRALVHFADGTETLVVETTFVGAGTNFAWVVPLPAAPEITAVPRTVFTNLERLFQPEVIHKQTAWWMGMIYLGFVAFYLWLGVMRRKTAVGLRVVFLTLLLLGGSFCVIMPSGWRGPRFHISIAPRGVQILAQQQVGGFDTVTLSSPDGAALTCWLNDNGFAVPAAAAPVIADYAKAGWVFAAAKLSRPAATGKTSPHPLAFKFKTDRAVYPLRLTGVENDRCLVELYVFGASRAELPGFRVEYCLATDFPKEWPMGTNPLDDPNRRAFYGPEPGHLRIRHPALRSLAAGAPVGTKLTGTLDSAAMSRDANFIWVPFERRLPSLYIHDAASTRAINLGVALLLITLPCTRFWLRRTNGTWTLRLLATICGGVVIVAVAYYFFLPKAALRIGNLGRDHPAVRWGEFRELRAFGEHLETEIRQDRFKAPLPEHWNLQHFVKAGEAYEEEPKSPNARFTWALVQSGLPNDQKLREEATPGNLLFRPTARGTEVIWHDVDCVEHLLATLPVRAP